MKIILFILSFSLTSLSWAQVDSKMLQRSLVRSFGERAECIKRCGERPKLFTINILETKKYQSEVSLIKKYNQCILTCSHQEAQIEIDTYIKQTSEITSCEKSLNESQKAFYFESIRLKFVKDKSEEISSVKFAERDVEVLKKLDNHNSLCKSIASGSKNTEISSVLFESLKTCQKNLLKMSPSHDAYKRIKELYVYIQSHETVVAPSRQKIEVMNDFEKQNKKCNNEISEINMARANEVDQSQRGNNKYIRAERLGIDYGVDNNTGPSSRSR
jgi:hypothetical protein